MSSTLSVGNETRVAVLVDCDNVSPEILDHALRIVAQFGRVVLRRGYGEPKTPDALRNASDQFFEWTKAEVPAEPVAEAGKATVRVEASKSLAPTKLEALPPLIKRRPRFVIEAVTLLVGDASEGKVHLGPLGQYLKRTDPAFSPKAYGHSGLLDMVKTYDLLHVQQEQGGHWSVGLVSKVDES